MRFLVTGATGFIGTHLCHRLVGDGHEVVALVRTPKKAEHLPATGIEVLPGDLSLFQDEAMVLDPCDVVIHLAAVIAGKNEAEYHAINHQAVVDLVTCIERQDWTPKRFLFASSLAAGGPSSPTRPLREEDEARPIDAYGIAKKRAEQRLREARFPTTAFRPPLVLGPGDPATRTMYKMAASGLAFRPSGADQVLSTVDVVDLVDAIARMALEEGDEHQLYYVAQQGTVTTSDLLRQMGTAQGKRVRVVPIPRPLLFVASVVSTAASRVFRFTNQLDRKQYLQITAPAFVCDASRLRRRLGWIPDKEIEQTLREAVQGYRERGDLPKS